MKREKADQREGPEALPSTEAKGKRKEVTPAVILQQLQLLRGDLGGVESSVGGVLEGEGEKEAGVPPPTGIVEKVKASSSLLSRLGLTSAPPDAAVSSKGAASGKTGPGEGQLEKRVAEMERVLGASEADVDEVGVSFLDYLLSQTSVLSDSSLLSL